MAGAQETCHSKSFAADSNSKEGDDDPEGKTNIAVEQPFEIVENATLDLDQVAAQYVGVARLQRLMFIARRCPALRREALTLAEKFVLMTYDTMLATTIYDMKLAARAKEKPEPDPEPCESSPIPEWIERTRKEAQQRLKALETERQQLMSERGRNMARNIWWINVRLAHLYLDCGDLHNACKTFHSARNCCVTFGTQICSLLGLIRVYAHMKSWNDVRSVLQEAQDLMDQVKETVCSEDGKEALQSELNCAWGLMLLATRDYSSAAHRFLQVNFDFCDFPQMLSKSGVTIYTVLCALTTFERKKLQKYILFSRKFSKFLELEPEWREIVERFTRGLYSSSLRRLQQLKGNLLLDIHLHPHVHTLLPLIRKRALCEYMDPYLSADMNKMAVEFNTPVDDLEKEFADMIMGGQISARIDSHNKALYFKKVDQRSVTFEQALATGKDYLRKSKALLLRAAVVKNKIMVKAKRSRPTPDEPPDDNPFPNVLKRQSASEPSRLTDFWI